MTPLELALEVLDAHATQGRWTRLYPWAARIAHNQHTHDDKMPRLNPGCTRCDVVFEAASQLRRHIPDRQPEAA